MCNEQAEAEQKQQELQHLAEVERTQLLQNMAQTEEEREALRAKLEELVSADPPYIAVR